MKTRFKIPAFVWQLTVGLIGLTTLATHLSADPPAGFLEGANALIREAHERNRSAEQERYLTRLSEWTEPTNRLEQMTLLSCLESMKLAPDKAVAAYARLVTHPSDDVRQLSVLALGRQGTNASALLPVVLDMFSAPGASVNLQAACAAALHTMGADSEVAERLTGKLAEPTIPPRLKLTLTDALGSIGKPATIAMPLLQAGLEDPSTAVQFASYRALGRIQGATAKRIAPRRFDPSGTATTTDLGTQFQMLDGLGTESAPGFVATLVAEYRNASTRPYKKAHIVQTLERIGRSDPVAVGLLVEAGASPDSFLADMAVLSLRTVDRDAGELVPVLASGLASPNPKVRYEAAAALKTFTARRSEAFEPALEALQRCTSQHSHFEIGVYLELLRALGKDAAPAAETLVAMLQPQSPVFRGYGKFELHYLRGFIFVTLADIGVPASALSPILDALANSTSEGIHEYAGAARAAASLPGQAKRIVPLLSRALSGELRDHRLTFEPYFSMLNPSGEYTSARIEAVRALGAMGPAAGKTAVLLQPLSELADNPEDLSVTRTLGQEARIALRKVRGN